MISLEKTPQTISLGRMLARINEGLRRNNLRALSLEFGERAYAAEVKAHEAHFAAMAADTCDNDGCWSLVRSAEDFCSEECWEEWHAKYDPETLDRATVRR